MAAISGMMGSNYCDAALVLAEVLQCSWHTGTVGIHIWT